MTQNEDANIVLRRDDWEKFLSSIQRFMSIHQQTLDRLRELSDRNKTLAQQSQDIPDSTKIEEGRMHLRQSLRARLFGSRQETIGQAGARPSFNRMRTRAAPLSLTPTCRRCGRELLPNDRFCDACGQRIRP